MAAPDPSVANPSPGSGPPLRVGLIGARGYVGQELISLLDGHPAFKLVLAGSRERAGQAVRAPQTQAAKDLHHPAAELCFEHLSPRALAEREFDALVLALPNGKSGDYIAALDAAARDVVILDLSADHRFDATWCYGLPERNRQQLSFARRIANPGCYATGVQLGLAPLLPLLDGPARAFGVSGYSGAGTRPSPKNDPAHLRDNLLAYQLVGHVHEREVSLHLDHPVHFFPHVAPWFRGIHLTIEAALRPDGLPEGWRATDGTRASVAVRDHFQRFYAEERWVQVVEEAPRVQGIAGRHHAEIGGFAVTAALDRVVFCVGLDNLLKGAATQAIQNLNLAFGLEECLGLPA